MSAAPPYSKEPRSQAGPPARSHDQLLDEALRLGLSVPPAATTDELSALIAVRRETLERIDRAALRELAQHARADLPPDADVESMARLAAGFEASTLDGLSPAALEALAVLRGITVEADLDRAALVRRLRGGGGGFWEAVRRGRRRMVARLVSGLLDESPAKSAAPTARDAARIAGQTGAAEARKTLRDDIESLGVVGGLATRLRGAADLYIQAKLDEIERRIDQKLNQIDHQLAEWRDRELSHRLRILRVTLAFSVLVALVSLGYNYMKNRSPSSVPSSPPAALHPGAPVAGEP